jgi:hypothetical protein
MSILGGIFFWSRRKNPFIMKRYERGITVETTTIMKKRKSSGVRKIAAETTLKIWITPLVLILDARSTSNYWETLTFHRCPYFNCIFCS